PASPCPGQYLEHHRRETTGGWGRPTGSLPSERTGHGHVCATYAAACGSRRGQSPGGVYAWAAHRDPPQGREGETQTDYGPGRLTAHPCMTRQGETHHGRKHCGDP